MSTMLVAVENVVANPWQTRTVDDPAHIAGLAESIRENGLLQTPLARLTPAGDVAELVFGHRRLAAWKLAKPGEAFPVEIRALTDRQMSDLVAEENSRRKDLSPIETARAIQRRINDFGLSQLEAGRPFGYTSQGSVSNLLRLLRLPESVQVSVANGELPERLARQMINVAALDPKGLGKIAKEVAKLDASERESHITQGLCDILDEHGREIESAVFEPNWPSKPIALNGDAPDGGPDELRACIGCPHLLRYESMDWCTLPACYDLKAERFLTDVVAQASERLGIPAAGPDELPAVVFTGTDYQHIERGRRLLKAKSQAVLGLRLVAQKERGYYGREVLGAEHVALASVNPDAVEKFLKAGASVTPAVAAAAVTAIPGSPKALAAAAKLRQQEEEARDARRLERAANLRIEHDIVWLVQHASEWIGDQLEISGGILAYVVTSLEPSEGGSVIEFEGLRALKNGLDGQIKQAEGDDADRLRRHHLALSLLLNNCFSYYGRQPMPQWWKVVTKGIQGLATVGARLGEWGGKPGLSVDVPAGWDRPPVHHTEYNCWECGRFAGQRKLTKRDQAEGWLERRRGKELLAVYCPEHKDAAPATNGNGHAPTPKAKKAKLPSRLSQAAVGATLGKLSKAAKQGRA